jgi:hypothetical protein
VLYLRGDDTRLFEVAPLPGALPAGQRPVAPAATRVPLAPPAAEPTRPVPRVHSADSGDIPVTLIPIVRPDVPRDATPAKEPPSPPSSAPATAAPASSSSEAPGTTTPIEPSDRVDEIDDDGGGGRRWVPWLIVLSLVLAVLVGGGILFVQFLADDGQGPGPDPTDAQQTDEPTPRATVNVPGAGPDIDTGVQCAAGEVVVMTATGTVDQDTAVPDPLFGPDGYLGPPSGYRAVYADYPPGALVGGLLPVDEVDTFDGFVDDGTGTSTYRAEYSCPVAGTIWLGVNDPILFDNAGGFDVAIW